MIEDATGQIQLPAEGISIGPLLTREQFLASPLGSRSRELVHNGLHSSFALPAAQYEGHSFAWSLWFHGSALRRVSIQCADPEFGLSWSEWSEEREMARKRFHDSLLQSALGPDWSRRRFAWGTIDSSYHPQDGSSTLGVTYAV